MKFPRLQMLFTILSIPCLLLGHPLEIEKSAFPSDRILNISEDFLPKGKNNVVLHTKQIRIDGFPNAFNPSLIKTEKGTLLFFRNQPYFETLPFISETGYVRLNEALDPISAPQLISTRNPGDPTPQQSEDCRVFSLGNELYLIYNDNLAVTSPSDKERRDIFVAKLIDSNGRFVIDTPKKLTHSEKYKTVLWQKNWQPFDWEGTLMMGYTINPHEILFPNMETGVCPPIFRTEGDIGWHWGKLRGGAPAQRFGDHYLSFFHSPIPIVSETTGGRELMHYFMGAYTFSAEPPFNLTGISPTPIFADNFYTPSSLGIRCMYPGGFYVDGDYIYLACGKDDHEVWIVVIDKEKLYNTLLPVKQIYPEL